MTIASVSRSTLKHCTVKQVRKKLISARGFNISASSAIEMRLRNCFTVRISLLDSGTEVASLRWCDRTKYPNLGFLSHLFFVRAEPFSGNIDRTRNYLKSQTCAKNTHDDDTDDDGPPFIFASISLPCAPLWESVETCYCTPDCFV